MLGFVNGLAIVILIAQLRQFEVTGAAGRLHWVWGPELWTMLALTAVTVAVTALLPRITRAIPAALGAIVLVTLAAHFLGLHASTGGSARQGRGSLWPLQPAMKRTDGLLGSRGDGDSSKPGRASAAGRESMA